VAPGELDGEVGADETGAAGDQQTIHRGNVRSGSRSGVDSLRWQ